MRGPVQFPEDDEEDEGVESGFTVEPEPDTAEESPAEQPSPMGFPFQVPPGSSSRPGVFTPPSEAE